MLAVAAVLALGLASLEPDVSPDSYRARVKLGWVKGDRANKSAPIELVVALSQPAAGVAALERVLEEVADPTHPRYGAHLSNDRVHDMVKPSATALQAVRAHLSRHNIRDTMATPNADFLLAQTTVGAVEAAFGCSYFELP